MAPSNFVARRGGFCRRASSRGKTSISGQAARINKTEIVHCPHARKQSPPDRPKLLPDPCHGVKRQSERRDREAAWARQEGGKRALPCATGRPRKTGRREPGGGGRQFRPAALHGALLAHPERRRPSGCPASIPKPFRRRLRPTNSGRAAANSRRGPNRLRAGVLRCASAATVPCRNGISGKRKSSADSTDLGFVQHRRPERNVAQAEPAMPEQVRLVVAFAPRFHAGDDFPHFGVAADSPRSRLGARIPVHVRLLCRTALRGAAEALLCGQQDRRRRRRGSPARSATKRTSTVLSTKELATVLRERRRMRRGLDFETALATRPARRIGIPASYRRTRSETKRAIPLQKAPEPKITGTSSAVGFRRLRSARNIPFFFFARQQRR